MLRQLNSHVSSLLCRSMVTYTEFAAKPFNEPIKPYTVGSAERTELHAALDKYESSTTDVPIVIGGKEMRTNTVKHQVMPHDHSRKLATYYYADKPLIQQAVDNCLSVREEWEHRPLRERVDIMFRAADLVAGKYRMDLNATTMLGQAKTIFEAEIDAACELADFLRFNAYFAMQLEKYEPISTDAYTDKMIYRGLEGFVAAISPFNFTAIGGNLASCPSMMGNVVVWKPSDTCVLSNYIAYQLLTEAGVPPGVINFVTADGPDFGDVITGSPHLAAVNFTGSVPTFHTLWKMVANNLDKYVTYPRLVGECGGKNFHFAHPSADPELVAMCSIRSAFEYSGQKCSAAGRAYIPESIWPAVREKMIEQHQKITVGSPRDANNMFSAVIDKRSFDRISGYLNVAKNDKDSKVVAGGTADQSKGYFVQPTIVETNSRKNRLMTEEIFGPVLTVYPYKDSEADEILGQIKDDTPFGLTGAVFARDEKFMQKSVSKLRDAVGNLYLNDKSTGSIVGQQPFGGARQSGTNDKAGGPHYALKWCSPQTIKQSVKTPGGWKQPCMEGSV